MWDKTQEAYTDPRLQTRDPRIRVMSRRRNFEMTSVSSLSSEFTQVS